MLAHLTSVLKHGLDNIPACLPGEAVYVDDIPAPRDCLYGAFIYSTQLLSTTMGVKEYVQSEFDNVEAGIINVNKDLFPGTITFDDFLWAFGVLRSRVFPELRGDKISLITFADLVRSLNSKYAYMV